MSQPIRGQGGYLVFLISPKDASLVEDVEILLPVKFCWILFSGFRGKVEMSQQIIGRGGHFVFSVPTEKHKLGRRHWDLTSYQVSLNSVQRFQRRSRKCLGQSEARTAILFFPIGPKNTNLVEALRSCCLWSFVKYHPAVSEEKSKMSQPIRGQAAILFFPIGPKKHKTW